MRRMAAGLALLGVALLALSFVLPSRSEERPAASGSSAAARSTSPTASSALAGDAARGRALFQAKGCAMCHSNRQAVAPRGLDTGPNLSSYRPNPEFVRAWPRDPRALRPATLMPGLDLSDEEIESLIAFLQAAGEGR